MKLKKRMAFLIVLVLICVAAFSFAACSNKEASTVTFVADNSVYNILKVKDGSEILPEDPAKDLYAFEGWYEDRALKNKFDFFEYTSNKNREDITVYAKFVFNGNTYKVTLNGNGGKFGSNATTSLNVREQEKITATITEPVRDGYVLMGWAKNKNGAQVWSFNSDIVTADTVLYAIWAKTYTVTFNANGSENTITAIAGDLINEPEKPTRNNYVFDGWATSENALEADWDFDKNTVTDDVTLYAVWYEKITEYDVEFVLNYTGAKNETKSTVRGLIAYEPEREGYIFNGWWNSEGEKDSDGNYILTTKVDLTKKITSNNVKVYASWIDVSNICSVLPSPVLSISGGDITWKEIEGAKSYNIVIWSYTKTEDQYLVKTTVNGNSYSFPSYYDQGIYYVKVRANGDGYTTANSAWTSRSFEFKRLSAPSVSFDLTTSVLSWTSVKNAYKYELYINDGLIELPANTLEYDFSDYDAGTYKINIKVTASGYADAAYSGYVSKLKLKTPQVTALYNKTNKSYELRWNEVVNANKYIVTINGKETKVDATYYTIPSSAWGEEKTLTYKVDAFDTDADYLISDAKTAKLGTPTEVTVKLEGDTKAINVKNGLASFISVNFDTKGGSKVIQQTVSSSSGLTYPAIPTREGYVFTGWYEDYNCTKLFDFSKEIRTNITLYAGWYKMDSSEYHIISSFSADFPTGGVGIGNSNFTNYGTSYSKRNYTYYCALNNGDYKISYKNGTSGTNYGTYFYAYNITTGEIILASTRVTTTAKSEVTFTANAGDVIVIETYRSNESYSSNYEIFIYGGKAPTAGGKFPANYSVAGGNYYVGGDKTFTAGVGTVVELTATEVEGKKFLGWYTEDGKLLTDKLTFKYTVESGATLVVKWE